MSVAMQRNGSYNAMIGRQDLAFVCLTAPENLHHFRHSTSRCANPETAIRVPQNSETEDFGAISDMKASRAAIGQFSNRLPSRALHLSRPNLRLYNSVCVDEITS
ncbi:conserved hypothetical membrane protein [Rhizobium rhizogenes K84]|uniref:Conserved hypothetical membrane protein n=1 Tax=Rhizobium rhizogenes (strain K84 / ATCC BAA-868) TaxID=311403 RepID=B9J9E9_RHIR8|nr:conserved hypothetical membrane protein [Rhizobium rhizogenes K84]